MDYQNSEIIYFYATDTIEVFRQKVWTEEYAMTKGVITEWENTGDISEYYF